MGTRVFTRTELEELGLPWDAPPSGAIVSDRMTEHRRWVVVHELIFRLADQAKCEAWRVTYEVPATEYQEGIDTWPETVTAQHVVAVERLRTIWITEPADDGQETQP